MDIRARVRAPMDIRACVRAPMDIRTRVRAPMDIRARVRARLGMALDKPKQTTEQQLLYLKVGEKQRQ